MDDNIENEDTKEQEAANTTKKVASMLSEISVQLKAEKDWREECRKIYKTYRSESDKDTQKKDSFNILWANVEIKRHSLYGSTPMPDIRRRHKEKDPVGKAISEILERAVNYTIDCQDLDTEMIYAVNDMLLPGRGVVRVRYEPYTTPVEDGEDTLDYEEAVPERVDWDKYIQGPGKKFSKVKWIAFEHELSRKEFTKRFGEDFVDKVSFGDEASEKKAEEKDESNIKKTIVYERWNKTDKKVYWIAKDYSEEFLDIVEDPLDLKGFWPIPAPLYAIEDSSSMIPITEYSQYATLAKELEDVTRRRRKLIQSIKARGAYDASLSELEKIFQEDDNVLVALESAAAWTEKGGIDKAIWFAPIKEMVDTYQVLGQQRQGLVSQIYELTGISDIVRGDTNPNETLGAQEIKASFASARFEKQKQAVESYTRNLIRLLSEVICTFSRETLVVMTGLNYPTEEQQEMSKQAMQALGGQLQQMQQAQQQGQQVPGIEQVQQQMQKHQETLQSVNWEQIEKVLSSDIEREYRIDVETSATVEVNRQKEQQAMTAFMNGMGQFIGFAGDGMSTGLVSQKAAKQMLIAFSRKFKLGQDVEDELEMEQPPAPDPEKEKLAAEQKLKEQEQQFEQQLEQQKFQMEQQSSQQSQQYEQEKMRMELQIEQQRMQMETQRMQMDLDAQRQAFVLEQEKAAMEQQILAEKARFEEEKHERELKKMDKVYEYDVKSNKLSKANA